MRIKRLEGSPCMDEQVRETNRHYEFRRASALADYRVALLGSLLEEGSLREAREQLRRLEGHIGRMKALEGSNP